MSLILIFYGVRTVKTVQNENWIYALFKILVVLVIALAIAVVVVIIVLVIIACVITGEGADLSGLSFGGGGKIKRKKQQKI